MTLLPRILTAIALVGLLTMAAPQAWTEAQAQTASNLKCKGCVGSKDIGKKAVKLKNLDKKLQNKIQENMMGANRHAFRAEINANATRDLLVVGTFVLFAQCILNQGVGAELIVGLRNKRNGWFHPFRSGPLLSTEEIIFATLFAISGAPVFQTREAPGGISPTGDLLGFIFFGAALNVFSNSCLVQGWADAGPRS